MGFQIVEREMESQEFWKLGLSFLIVSAIVALRRVVSAPLFPMFCLCRTIASVQID